MTDAQETSVIAKADVGKIREMTMKAPKLPKNWSLNNKTMHVIIEKQNNERPKKRMKYLKTVFCNEIEKQKHL